YKDLRLQLFLLHGGGVLAGFWRDTIRKADEYDRFPVLIAKENGEEPLVILQRSSNGFTGLFTDRELPSLECTRNHCHIFKLDEVLARPYDYGKRTRRS